VTILDRLTARILNYADKSRILTGRQLAWQVRDLKTIDCLADVEFSVFSQFGDDGIIQWLIHHIAPLPETFVEFGVGNYRESNTRFLLVNDNWRGLVMEGSKRGIDYIRRDEIFWRHHLLATCTMITAENINDLLISHGFEGDIGILHIDIDGNDYWVWKALTAVRPAIAIIEYNSVLGTDRSITIPYNPTFSRGGRTSNLYHGASLPALCDLAQAGGYDFIGCNSAGNNAYFVRSELNTGIINALTAEEGYVMSKFGDRADSKRDERRLALISGLPVINTRTGDTERI
jgi:hypothetical protein